LEEPENINPFNRRVVCIDDTDMEGRFVKGQRYVSASGDDDILVVIDSDGQAVRCVKTRFATL